MCGCNKGMERTSTQPIANRNTSGETQVSFADQSGTEKEAITQMAASKDAPLPIAPGRTAIMYPKRGTRVRVDLR